MFSNQRKTIGVFMERSTSEFQNKLCQGLIYEAERLGYNVAIFAAYGNYGQNERYFAGDQTLWEVPVYEDFAGIILALDTIVQQSGRDKVLSFVKSRCHCPIISVREIVDGVNNLLVDNKTCMNGIVDHFVQDHGFTRLSFMTGPKEQWFARERLECFLKKMEEYNLPVTEHQIFWGDFWKNKGKEACDWFLQAEERPQAILCANDHMAMAVASELNGRGFRIPEDICVSGYDGLKGTLSFTPSITTVEVSFFDMGKKAVDIIHEKQECPEQIDDYYFDAIVKKRESCGCMRSGCKETLDLRQHQYESGIEDENRQTQFHFMSMHFSECHSIEEISDRITYYIYNVKGFRDYCLCLCEDIMEREDMKTYTDQMFLRIGIKERNNIGHIRTAFSRKDLLPASMTGFEPQSWYFAPIHFQDKCFGYEAFRFYGGEETGNMYQYWNIIIGNQIQNIITYQKMQRLMFKLESMYDRDALTGIYNRRGFDNYANSLFEQAKSNKERIFFAIVDMDGMKQINDNYGHVEGDFALCKVCDAIRYAWSDSAIFARTGGDEFEIIVNNITEKQGLVCMGNVQRYLDEFNQSNEKEYDIHASFGSVCRVPKRKDTINNFIRESDEIMYSNKVVNKTKRGEPLR